MSGRQRIRRETVTDGSGRRVVVERRAVTGLRNERRVMREIMRDPVEARGIAASSGIEKWDMPLAADVARLLQGTPLRFPAQLWGDAL